MAIEKILTDLTASINRLAAALEGSGAAAEGAVEAMARAMTQPAAPTLVPAAAAEATSPSPAPAPVTPPAAAAPSADLLPQVRKALTGMPEAKALALIQSYGVARLSEVPADKLPELLNAARAA